MIAILLDTGVEGIQDCVDALRGQGLKDIPLEDAVAGFYESVSKQMGETYTCMAKIYKGQIFKLISNQQTTMKM